MTRWVAWIGGILVLAVLLIVAGVRMQPRPVAEWVEFAIGPPAGYSLSIQRAGIRGDGASLIALLGWAHRLPTARVLGPPAVYSRFSIQAAVPEDEAESMRALLRRELETRFRLESHVETRSFEVWVLTSTGHPVLEPSKAPDYSIRIMERSAKLVGGPTANIAAALQGILGKSVVDETGISGNYNLEFAWGEDRERSLIAVMRDKFGLMLTPSRRDLEALVVDSIRPDFAMAFFDGIGRATARTPAGFRRSIARLFTIR